MAATSPPRRGVAPHVDSVTLRARLGAGSSAPNHRDKALEAQCARHARRHASDPENHDVLYAWGLTLQERAECAEETAAAAPQQQQQQQQQQQRGGTDAAGHARHHGSRATRDAYLRAACDAYAKAISLHPRFPAALYNHGIALGDLARAAQGADAEAATSLWKSACAQYARAVVAAESACEERHHGHRGSGDDARSIVPKASASARGDAARVVRVASPTDTVRALNNWGLAEQRLAGLASSAPGRLARLTRAASRFREALRRDPGFHRAAYNLGTVMYALAELAARRSRKLEAARGSPEEVETLEALARGATGHGSNQGLIAGATAPAAATECRAAAAAHICLAAAGADDDASRDAYRASLALVRRALPSARDSRSDPADVTPETPRRFFVFRGSLRRERERGALGGWRAATSFAADHAFFFELPSGGAEGGLRDASRDTREPRDTVESVECFRDGHTHETDKTDTRMCVRLADITRVAAAARDASFPTPGFRGNDAASAKAPFGFFTHERDGTARWFVAPDEPSRDLWVDALSLASDIARRGKSGALERELLGV